jgi:hypothetical protein
MTQEQPNIYEAVEAEGEPTAPAREEVLEVEIASYRQRLTDAARRYRDLLLATSPEVPAELVAGETPDEIEASFNAAREVVDKVRRQLESQVNDERVPAGAPPRTAPDLSGLSPAEKITYALSHQSQ